MKENNIDEIFSRKLQHLEKTPRPQAWEKLSAQMVQPKRKVIPLWWTLSGAGIAASVALMVFLTHNSPDTNTIKPLFTNRHDSVNTAGKNTLKTEKRVTENKLANNETKAYQPKNSNNTNVVKQSANNLQSPAYTTTVAVKDNSSELKKETQDIISDRELTETTTLLAVRDINLKSSEGVLQSDLVIIVEEPETVAYEPQKTKVSKVFQQLKNLKEGNKVDLKELGISKQTFVAAIREKFN
jgi:hypothetical protein